MRNEDLYDLFIEELSDMYSSEQQIVQALPKLIKASQLPDLKDALTKHLKETENQVIRIEKIYTILNVQPKEVVCEAMRGLLREADQLVQNRDKTATTDAAIISAAQKVEHYEIASYGTLKSFAKQLGLDSEVTDLIQDTIEEESAADKKLTKIAEGTLFTSGVNKEAVETSGRKHKK
jgi:ferritin-like metal-binding protein YciE